MKKAKSLLIGLVSILFPLTSCGGNTSSLNTRTNTTVSDENTQGLKYVLLEDNTYGVGGGNAKELSEIIIPSQFQGKKVTKIIDRGFYRFDHLKKIIIPDSVTSIGEYAFFYCISLTSIVIPDSVTSIGLVAFSDCYRLVEVINKSSLNITVGSEGNGYVAYYAKQVITDEKDSKLSTDNNGFVTYNDGTDIWLINYIGSEINITIPNSVTTIGNYAFSLCTSLISIVIADSVTSIGDRAFYDCTSLTSIVIPDSVTTIGKFAFYECTSLTSITIPDSVTTISDGAFYDCTSLTSIVIPDSVTTIRDYAFRSCTSLTSIVIPDSVTSIGEQVFSYCTSLASVFYKGTLEQGKNLFESSLISKSTTVFYYSETQPIDTTYEYWHYVDGEPTPW